MHSHKHLPHRAMDQHAAAPCEYRRSRSRSPSSVPLSEPLLRQPLKVRWGIVGCEVLVPESVATVEDLCMWLLRKHAPGKVLTHHVNMLHSDDATIVRLTHGHLPRVGVLQASLVPTPCLYMAKSTSTVLLSRLNNDWFVSETELCDKRILSFLRKAKEACGSCAGKGVDSFWGRPCAACRGRGEQEMQPPWLGRHVAVTSDVGILADAAEKAHMKGNLQRAGTTGIVNEVDLSDGTVRLQGCDWWIAIAALTGYEHYQAYPSTGKAVSIVQQLGRLLEFDMDTVIKNYARLRRFAMLPGIDVSADMIVHAFGLPARVLGYACLERMVLQNCFGEPDLLDERVAASHSAAIKVLQNFGETYKVSFRKDGIHISNSPVLVFAQQSNADDARERAIVGFVSKVYDGTKVGKLLNCLPAEMPEEDSENDDLPEEYSDNDFWPDEDNDFLSD